MLEILSDLKISNCETRHCSVVSVGCPLYSDTQLTDSWQLGRRRAGDARDSRRQDRHYPRKVVLITSTNGRHPLSNLDSSVSHFSHKASLFSCNLSKSSPRQDPISSRLRMSSTCWSPRTSTMPPIFKLWPWSLLGKMPRKFLLKTDGGRSWFSFKGCIRKWLLMSLTSSFKSEINRQ